MSDLENIVRKVTGMLVPATGVKEPVNRRDLKKYLMGDKTIVTYLDKDRERTEETIDHVVEKSMEYYGRSIERAKKLDRRRYLTQVPAIGLDVNALAFGGIGFELGLIPKLGSFGMEFLSSSNPIWYGIKTGYRRSRAIGGLKGLLVGAYTGIKNLLGFTARKALTLLPAGDALEMGVWTRRWARSMKEDAKILALKALKAYKPLEAVAEDELKYIKKSGPETLQKAFDHIDPQESRKHLEEIRQAA